MRKAHLVLAMTLSCSNGSEKLPPLPAGATQVDVAVDAEGYHPAELTAPAGKPVRVVFTRTTEEGCGQEVVFPHEHIRKDLPLKRPVAVDLAMPSSGRVTFTCGMDMYEGAIVAQ